MASELLDLLWRTTVAASLAVIVVTTVRRPLRRMCGCGVAYAAWLAVPLTALASLLPRPAFHVPALGVTTFTLRIVDSTPTVATGAGWTWQSGVALAWAIGALVMLLLHVRAQRAYVRSLGPLTKHGDMVKSRSPSAGPSLVGLWRPVIAIPADFDQRYTRVERELIVAHERAHAKARDPLVNLFCAALSCLWWFNPLIHRAARLLRDDQELARDADVMRAFPGTRRAYADAMLKTQMSSPVQSALVCRWEPKHPLQERVMNLSRTPSNAARRAGRLVLAVVLSCGAYASWAEQGVADRVRPEASFLDFSAWDRARPSTVVTVVPALSPGQFLVRMRVTDLNTSKVMSEPRMVVRAGETATMETGDVGQLIRFRVTVDPSGKEATYTDEMWRDGRLERSQSATVSVDASRAAVEADGAVDKRPFTVVFRSSDRAELSCVADAFRAVDKPDVALEIRASWNGQEAAFKSVMQTRQFEAERLAASLSSCRVGADSRLTWSTEPRAAWPQAM